MVEVNIANEHGRYEEIWLNSVMSNKVFAMEDNQPAGWPDGHLASWTNTTCYTDP